MRLFLLATSFLFTATAQAAEPAPAQLLADKCSRCHGTEVYTRPNRLVLSRKSLDARVRNCDAMTSAGLSDAEIASLVQYLNDTFYKF